MSTAFVIVDVQNDFCEGGALAVAGGIAVAHRIADHLAASPDRYGVVVATRDYHLDPGEHFSADPDFVASWPPHCVVDSPGASFHAALDAGRIDAVFSKGRHDAAYSGFEGTHPGGRSLAEYLRDHDVDRVVIGGLATDHCVRATALDAAANGFTTSVREDLVAGVAPETTAAAIDQMRAAGVTLTPA